jgi:hypothetical protein
MAAIRFEVHLVNLDPTRCSLHKFLAVVGPDRLTISGSG